MMKHTMQLAEKSAYQQCMLEVVRFDYDDVITSSKEVGTTLDWVDENGFN